MNTDPQTGLPLPADAIQRILFIAPKIHVYNIPPLTSNQGYKAATWTENNNARQIFTARLRILETAIPIANPSPTSEEKEKVSTTLLLEDPATGALFAACPYTSPATVSQAIDSSRFFALVVVGDGGRKATLGIGFEERSEAFDFSISLQDARRVLGMENPGAASAPGGRGGSGKSAVKKEESVEKKDFSLKEGETITVNIGGRGRRTPAAAGGGNISGGVEREKEALFSIKPPPGSGSSGLGGGGGGSGMPFLPPPPSAREVKEERRRSRQAAEMTPQDLGFDDGEFGEFQ